MEAANSAEFCENCDHKIQYNFLKCENCKNTLSKIELNQEPSLLEDATATVHSFPTQWQPIAPHFLEHLEVKTELSQESTEAHDTTKFRRLSTGSDIKTGVLRNNKNQEQSYEAVVTNYTLYKCKQCDKSFKRLSLLKGHYARTHVSESDDDSENQSQIPGKRKRIASIKRSTNYQFALRLSSDSEKAVDNDSDDTSSIDVDSVPNDVGALYDAMTKLKQTPIGECLYKCRMCKKLTLELRQHLKHIIEHTGRKYNTCVICGDVFLDSISLDEHMAEAHKNKRQFEPDPDCECRPSGIIKCKVCGECFIVNSEFKRHKLWHAGPLTLHNCSVCRTGFSSASMLEKHKRTIHSTNKNLPKRYKCFLCEESFPFQILLTNHKRTHPEFFELIERTTIIHRHKDSNKIMYSCRTCGKSTDRQTTHLDHLGTHSTERPMFKCTLCSKQFTAKSTLKAHLHLHSNECLYKCEICNVSYRHRKTLRNHLIKHTGHSPVKCKYCGNGFRDHNLCMDHVRRVHTGETPYKCDICDEWFTTAAHLPAHKIQQHNVNTRVKRTVDVILA